METNLFPPDMQGMNGRDLRSYIMDDETALKTSAARQVRVEGLHVLTVWEFSRKSKTALFWLRQDVVELMKKGNWAVQIWRIDVWRDSGSFEDVRARVKDLGICWRGD